MQKTIYKDLETYEDTHWWYIHKRKVLTSLLEKYLSKKHSKRLILDAGCGTGGTLKLLSQYGEIFGVDLQDSALKHCKKIGLKNIIKADVEKLPYKNKFDLVTIFDVLEHVDEDKCLTSLHGALKKNGLLIISVPAYQWMWSGWDVANDHVKRYTKETLVAAVKRNNFKIQRVSYMYSFLVLPVFIVRKVKDHFYGKKYTSDIQLAGSPLVNSLMKVITTAEQAILSKTDMPFGLSVILVAKKR